MSLPRLIRRFYSSGGPPPNAAKAALESSTPKAVRIRRERFPESLSEANEGSVLSDAEKTTYDRLKSLGELTVEGQNGPRELSEEEWLERTNAKRQRLRGVKKVVTGADSEGISLEELRVVGHRIYLPNIIFRLVRNHTPPGQPYNPFEATFRVPQSLTKLDIRNYLSAMYGVETTYIRTDNRIADVRRNQSTYSMGRWRSEDTYKRAVVGLKEPFYFPQTREDMDVKAREERDKYINSKFEFERVDRMKTEYFHRLFKPTGYRNAGDKHTLRGKIIRKVMEQKLARENAVATAVKDMMADANLSGRLPAVPSTKA